MSNGFRVDSKQNDVIGMSSNVHEWRLKTKVHCMIAMFDATDQIIYKVVPKDRVYVQYCHLIQVPIYYTVIIKIRQVG